MISLRIASGSPRSASSVSAVSEGMASQGQRQNEPTSNTHNALALLHPAHPWRQFPEGFASTHGQFGKQLIYPHTMAMVAHDSSEISTLLEAWGRGDLAARDPRARVAKRSGQWTPVPFADFVASRQTHDVDVLDLHTALDELAGFDGRKSRVVELRFFCGLSVEEIGHVFQISIATVEREWQTARAWLYSRHKKRRADA